MDTQSSVAAPTDYSLFIKSKSIQMVPSGIEVNPSDLNDALFPFQRAAVSRALAQGRFCLGEDTGLGKTIQQLSWCDVIERHTQRPVFIYAPLAVSHQTAREAAKFGIDCQVVSEQSEVGDRGIYITNYQKMHRFDVADQSAVCIDEASILKNESGKFANMILDSFRDTPFKLSCSATFAPNDYTELGMQSEFVGAMTREEMLAMFFTHDGGETSKWRLKRHGQHKFWEWLSSWAVLVRKPSDLGEYDDSGYHLPGLNVVDHQIDIHIDPPDGMLVWIPSGRNDEKRYINKASMAERCEEAAWLVNRSPEQWIVWCNSNAESTMLKRLILEAVEVKGSDSDEHKVNSILGFQSGEHRVIVTKDSIFGFGINLQNCFNMTVFPNDSYERYYQLIRRCYRFGQKNVVNVHRIYHQLESYSTIGNVGRKADESDAMYEAMMPHQLRRMSEQHAKTFRDVTAYNPSRKMVLPDWLKSA
jgi:hypothetical protein